MGVFLNTEVPFEAYKATASTRFFVDKTLLISEILRELEDNKKYICITRPRRFGKTVMANMIAAYFGNAVDSRSIFDQLQIAGTDTYEEHLNKHDVIYIDFSIWRRLTLRFILRNPAQCGI